MAGQQPEESVRWPVLYQRWQDMTFLHWAYAPEEIQSRLPAGFRPHLCDGQAWVGLTPFLARNSRPPFVPPLPGLSTFPETNLRTYVIGPDGRDAIWFFSLEADSLPTTAAARLGFCVPYFWADMAVEVGVEVGVEVAGRITYRSTRRPPHSPVGHRIVVEPGETLSPAELSERDHFLTGRWRACATIAGRRAYVGVEHRPWPLHRATVHDLAEDLLAAAGLSSPQGDPLAHYSPGVDVKLGPVAFLPSTRGGS